MKSSMFLEIDKQQKNIKVALSKIKYCRVKDKIGVDIIL